MDASLLIVSRNRYTDLQKTLEILQKYIEKEKHEILVLLDGCTDGSQKLIKLFPEVKWEISDVGLGASKARSILYKKARGKILFGFDDDAHPLQENFIAITENLFNNDNKIGIVAFREIKGEVDNKEKVLNCIPNPQLNFLTNEFVGCGFAIKSDVYGMTRGFPVWIDIYGEEACVSWEVLNAGFDILFTSEIIVNHRVNKNIRRSSGANVYRFEKQLTNTTSFYLVYYPFPLLVKQILKLYFHNFRKYAITNRTFLKAYFTALKNSIFNLSCILKYRQPVSKTQVKKVRKLPNPFY